MRCEGPRRRVAFWKDAKGIIPCVYAHLQGVVMRLLVRYREDVLSEGFVSQVLDGDGCILQTGDGTHVVRLYGIDAPELNQTWGWNAREYLRGLVGQQNVLLRRHELDQHGRLVADLSVEGVGRVSVAMVAAGWAWWFKRYARGDVELRDAEIKARADRRGVWRDEKPTPPWQYRRRRVR